MKGRDRLLAASAALPPERRLVRRRSGRVVGGVAAGLAEHLRVPVLAVRIVLIALTLAGGSGALAYALFWFLLPQGDLADEPERDESGPQAIVLAVAAAVALVLLQVAGIGSEATLPLFAAGTGVALVWRQADDAQRARFRIGGVRAGWHALAGLVLLSGGLAGFLASRGELRAAREGLLSTVVVVGGLALLGLPWLRQVLLDLRTERRERIRSQERADLSAQVHDSVLQTLALIQRAADDPREVTRLARSQERELRTWLYRPAAASLTLEAALEQAVAEVEEDHGVRVEVVVVGDVTVDDRLAALVAATREAVVNAAKHAQVPLVQVYAEVEGTDVTVFVRDRGTGFDPAAVPPDRYGLAQSVVGRVERVGGDVRVRSAPGEGTEVRLTLTREARETSRG